MIVLMLSNQLFKTMRNLIVLNTQLAALNAASQVCP